MKRSFLAASALMASIGFAVSAAHAGFVITNTRVTSGGFDYVNFLGQNTGSGTGTKLNGFDATATTPGSTTSTAMVFNFQDLDGDGTNDANITGSSPLTTTSFAGSYMRIGTLSNFTLAAATPANFTSDPGGTGNPTANPLPAAAYSNVHSFEVAGVSGVPPLATTAVTFAHIVVPTGTAVTLAGLIGGDTGNSVSFTSTSSVGPTTDISLSATPAHAVVGTVTVVGSGGAYVGTVLKLGTAVSTGSFIISNVGADPTEVLLWITGNSDADAAALTTALGANGTLVDLTKTGLDADASKLLAYYTTQGNTGTPAIGAPTFLVRFPQVGTGSTADANNTDFNITLPTTTLVGITAVPEPASLGLLALGGLGLLARRRSTKR